MGFFNKKGKEPEKGNDDKSEPKNSLPKPEKINFDGIEVNVVAMGRDGQPQFPADVPDEIKEAIKGILGQIAGGGAAPSSDEHECSCPKGYPGCAKTTLEDLVEWIKHFTIRIKEDPEDPEVTYIADADMELAFLAAFRVIELGMEQASLPVQQRVFAKKMFLNLMGNAGTILFDDDRKMDLSKQEIPDTIPNDWKTE